MPRTVDWDRWAASTGVAFVAAAVLGLLLVRDEPGPLASSEETVAWLGGERSEILTASIVFGVATVFLLWFAAAVARALREAGEPRLGQTAFGGAVAFAAMLSAGASVPAGMAYAVDTADPAAATTLLAVHWALHVLSFFPLAAMIGATSIAGRRSRLFPLWCHVVSEVAAVVVLLGGTVWAKDGFWAPDGGYAWIAAGFAATWVLVTSGLLLRGRPLRDGD